MPDMPANLDGWFDRLDLFVDRGICFTEAVVPEHLPCEQLRIPQHQAPHRDIVSVDRSFALMRSGDEFLHFEKALASAIRIDATRFRLSDAVLAEAGNVTAFCTAVTGAEHVGESALALRSPHDAVDIVGSRPVLRHAEKPVAIVRIVKALNRG